ncbi:hypothetical protein G6L16_018655 [Agrobacterium tumefaciens]|uniref:hypothetical protein n=1 Tax=Agrobacterium tumefaciens TaxID=358 RepID=UPI001571763C|nr:hypothetical protein [Agrobacterium tumefaciens]NSZ65162.1 hypothetical protein [Agrobacterium tumefaciens]NTA71533.1 hypothetical protein [Agrobacterium tumefaciens]WIE40237.1 hypothetical protein G6L16_018655 [Agrobacterium tumefaciens]
MEASATASIWSVLWPVIVGGVIAVVGTVIGPLFSHILTSKAAEREKRQKLFETMITALFEFDHWLDLKRSTYVYGDTKQYPISPLSKAIAVASMHFPETMVAIRDIDLKATEYEAWMTRALERRINGDVKNMNEGFADAYMPYREALLAFQREIPAMVTKYRL